MGNPNNTCLIGIDGGGTACRMALVMPKSQTGRRYDLTLGPANVMTDRAGAFANMQQGVRALCEQAGIGVEQLKKSRMHAGLAGILTPAQQLAVAVELKQRLGVSQVTISGDQVSTVKGALKSADGFLVGVGTGSFLACQTGGKMRFIGGWGLDLGDEASGAWLGRGLLSAVLHRNDGVDGMAGRSPICDAMLARFNGTPGVCTYATGASPANFGKLAPLVVTYANDGDPVAQKLMRKGVGYIVQGLTALGHKGGDLITLTGGMAGAYDPWLPDEIRAGLCAPKGSALDGALYLAAQKGAGL